MLGLPDFSFIGRPYEPGVEFHLLSNYEKVFNSSVRVDSESFYTMFGETTHDPYRATNNQANFLDMIWNTVGYAVFSAILHAAVPCLVGYLCSRYRYKFSEFIYTFLLIQMMIPIVGAYPSELAFLKATGLYDSLWGNLIQKFSCTGIYFFIFYAFFRGVPDSYEEAAEVDGASQFRIMLTIMMPLAIKTITTVALLKFVFFWNDYSTMVLYLPTRPTLAYGVHYLAFTSNANSFVTTAKIAISLCLALPIFLIFIFLKERLMGDVSMGGVKE